MGAYTIPLRERKYAQTKVTLAKTTIERLKKNRLKEISVKELCDSIPISEMTFYHYFPQKTAVLIYIMKLWYLETIWYLKQWEKESCNLEIIEALFNFTARKLGDHPLVLKEVIAFFSQKRGDVYFEELSMAEKLFAYPGLPGIEYIMIPKKPREKSIMMPYVENAIACGELPKESDSELIGNILRALYTGALMVMYECGTLELSLTFHRMFRLLWKGFHAEASENADHTVAESVGL